MSPHIWLRWNTQSSCRWCCYHSCSSVRCWCWNLPFFREKPAVGQIRSYKGAQGLISTWHCSVLCLRKHKCILPIYSKRNQKVCIFGLKHSYKYSCRLTFIISIIKKTAVTQGLPLNAEGLCRKDFPPPASDVFVLCIQRSTDNKQIISGSSFLQESERKTFRTNMCPNPSAVLARDLKWLFCSGFMRKMMLHLDDSDTV